MKKMLCLCLSMLLCTMMVACVPAEGEKMPAQQYAFELAADETLYIENMIFAEPVTVSGNYGQIMFANCEFASDVINAADQFTRVLILPDSTVNGKLILKNNVKEATLETPLPKYITFVPADVVCDDCAGAVVTMGDFETVFNGDTYHLSDAALFYDNTKPEAGLVPYEGQEANCYVVAQWWEKGEKVMLVECEYDPEM